MTDHPSNNLAGDCNYNWDEAFSVACRDGIYPIIGDDDVSTESFQLSDIAQVLASSEGERDGSNWLCVVLLNDTRYVFLSAGCDYTGWG